MGSRLEKKLDWINNINTEMLIKKEDELTNFIGRKLGKNTGKLSMLTEIQRELTIRELEVE